MSMIDPITRLPTPLSMLGGRQVLGGFPMSGLSGAGLGAGPTVAPIASSAAQAAPRVGGFASGLAGQIAPGSIGGGGILAEANALGGSGGRFFMPGGARAAASGAGQLLSGQALAGGGKLATAGRFVAPILAPIASNFLANQLGTGDTNRVQEAGRGFVRGAGWGVPAASALVASGIGAPGAPLVLAASAITGTIGAALDVLDAGSWFGDGGGEKAVDPDAVLTNIIQTAQLDPDTTAQIMDTYSINMQIAATNQDPAARAQAEAAALQGAANMALQSLQQRDSASSAANNTLALQAQAQDIFAPISNDITESSRLYADAMSRIRPSLPESYRGVADATVARELTSSQKLAAAYQAQAAVAPYVQQLTQYQQDNNSYAAQMFQQAMAQGQAGGQTALGPTTADLMAQLQPAP